MPLSPDWSSHVPDARLRERAGSVARLFRGDREVGLLLVQVQSWATQTSGHLWWRRFSRPYDLPWLFTLIDGEFGDHVTPQDLVDAELRDWDAGQFMFVGERLRADWLSAEESAHLRRTQFGVEDTDL